MTKSYVSMEQNVCLVCATSFDTGAILLDRRIRNSMEQHTVTGWGLCPEHQKLHDEGYVALVGIDPDRSERPYKPETVYRTGRVAHLKREAWDKVFNGDTPQGPMVFCGDDVFGVLEKLQGKAHE